MATTPATPRASSFADRYASDLAFAKRIDARRAEASRIRRFADLHASLRMVRGDFTAKKKMY